MKNFAITIETPTEVYEKFIGAKSIEKAWEWDPRPSQRYNRGDFTILNVEELGTFKASATARRDADTFYQGIRNVRKREFKTYYKIRVPGVSLSDVYAGTTLEEAKERQKTEHLLSKPCPEEEEDHWSVRNWKRDKAYWEKINASTILVRFTEEIIHY